LPSGGWLLWFSIRAKPLHGKPYRWATYIAVTTGLAGISLGLSSVSGISKGQIVGPAVGFIDTASFVLCCIGLFKRKRFGVVMFYIAYFLILFTPFFFDVYYQRPPNRTPQQQTQSGALFIYSVVTAFYFKKRWRLLSSPSDKSPAMGSEPQILEKF
jgi:hypothetical protein